jgi:fatty acid desaturase
MTTGNLRAANFISAKIEWPTWLLLVIVYSTWISLTLDWNSIPGWLLWLLGGYTVALHSSLQHEALHGHPTSNKRLNIALVWPPLTLWLPIELYVENHLRHHGADLTNPELDPESFFVTREKWQDLARWQQRILVFNNTFFGRMLLGPWLTVGGQYRKEFARLRSGDWQHLGILVRHVVSAAIVLYWIIGVCQMPFWIYLLAFAWAGTSMMLIRSFLEHRYEPDAAQRTVLVDGCPVTRLLFLNNNYHWVHHHHPELAWYRIPAVAKRERDEVLKNNGNYWYSGYFTIAWRFLLKPWTHPVHPAH